MVMESVVPYMTRQLRSEFSLLNLSVYVCGRVLKTPSRRVSPAFVTHQMSAVLLFQACRHARGLRGSSVGGSGVCFLAPKISSRRFTIDEESQNARLKRKGGQ